MDLDPGTRLKSTVCGTQVIVVRSPDEGVDLRCGGQPMVGFDDEVPGGAGLDDAFAEGTPTGKRYTDEASGLEVLCTMGGDGSLSIGDVPMARKDAKPLPSSD